MPAFLHRYAINPKRQLWLGFCNAATLALAAGVCGEAAAKHRPSPPANPGDVCAAPEAYVRDRIAKIIALKPSLHQSEDAPPKTVSDFIGRLEGKADAHEDVKSKIADLRREAAGVNELLRVQGCKAVDINQALGETAPWSAEIKK